MDEGQLTIEGIPAIDDGWWESILAEEIEGRVTNINKSKTSMAIKRSDTDQNWQRSKEIFDKDQIITVTVINFNKGGLLVDQTDIHGFIPCSHLVDLTHPMTKEEKEASLSLYVGKCVRVKIIECSPVDGRLVFSERAAQTESGRRAELMHELKVGQIVCGDVTNITDFGVFIDIGGVEGLIHISELSWGRVDHPSKILKLNQRVNVQILEIQPDLSRVALSLKRLSSNPWVMAGNIYHENQIVHVEITSITSYGAFARVDDCIEGLIHYSEIPLMGKKNFREVLKPGDRLSVKILRVDVSKQRLGLSMILNNKEINAG